MARHSVHEDERRVAAARFLVGESHSVTNEACHARQSEREPSSEVLVSWN
jgi:hypothetical protein